jgi:hypothetical protein
VKNFCIETEIKSPARVGANLNRFFQAVLMMVAVVGLSSCCQIFPHACALIGLTPSSPTGGSRIVSRHRGALLRPFAGSNVTGGPEIAPFLGNLSAVAVPSSAPPTDIFGVQRQPDCSLTFVQWVATVAPNGSTTFALLSEAPHFEKTLRNNAFLTTTQGMFPNGCVDASLGLTSDFFNFMGVGKNGREILGIVGISGVVTSGAMLDGSYTQPTTQTTDLPPVTIVSADLNNDGDPDVVAVNTSGARSSITVFLGKDDGTFQSGVNLALPGTAAQYAVIDDLNHDGIPDILVGSSGPNFAFSVFIGNGDGTFKPAQTVTPTGNTLIFSTAFITADVNGDGFKDIIAANGQVFLGKGDGITYTLVAQPAFPEILTATSNFVPQIVAADFNNDKKLDLATDDGATIRTFGGNGDGTFTAGPAYATVANFGFLLATDLDGDGNIDLWSGYAGRGFYGPDQSQNFPPAYALMGNGDGTFQGAPALPIKYTGTNLADLNGDGRLDLIGPVSGATQSTFSTFLTGTNGVPVAGPSLPLPAGVGVDSYAVGDLTSDKIPDLVFVSLAPQIQSFYVAMGKGDGSFQTPTAMPTPSLVPSGQDVNENITGLQLADINHDGKLDLVYSFSDQDANSQLFLEGFAVQLGNGDGTFKPPVITTTFSSLTAPVFFFTNTLSGVFDVNGDNFPDVFLVLPTAIVNGTTQHQVQLFVGKGDGTFSPPNMLTLTGNIRASNAPGDGSPFALADLNGDGKVDLIATGSDTSGSTPTVAIALGNGDGTFQAPTLLTLEGFGYASGPAIADFDGDGKLDLFANVVVEGMGQGIFPGNGNGTFQTISNADGTVSAPEAIVLAASGGAVATDLNDDGKPDLIVGNVLLLNKNGSVVPPAATTTTAVTSSVNPSTAGTNITFTATVISATAGTITGTVTFLDGATSLGTGTVGAGGVVMLMTSSLAAGSHSITAQYGGDANFATSTSPVLSQVVNGAARASTTTALLSSLNPSTTGISVTLTATVTSATAGTITGTVTFLDGATSLGTGSIGGGGKATLSTSALTQGSHSITAQYGGDTNFATSTSVALSQVVNAGALTSTTTMLTGPATAASGASVTFMASVTPANGAKVPTGTVTFLDGAISIGMSALNGSGSATFSTSTLATGSHSITAQYGGDANFSASTSTAASISITAAAGNFTLSVAPSSVTVTATQPGIAVVTVTPTNGFNQQVQFSCSNVPEGIDCEFEPHSVTPNGGPVTTMLAVTEEAEGNARGRKLGAAIGTWFGGGPTRFTLPMKTVFVPALGCELLLLAGLRRRRKSANQRGDLQFAFTVMLLVTIGTFVGGCSSMPNSHNTSATITVIGTGPGNQTAMAPLTINIQR